MLWWFIVCWSWQVTLHHEADGWIMCSTEAGRRGLVPATYIRIIKTKPRDDPFAVTDDPFGADDPFAGVLPPASSDGPATSAIIACRCVLVYPRDAC